MPVKAIYFDGQHAKRHEAQLDIRFGRVLVTGDDVARDEPVGAVHQPARQVFFGPFERGRFRQRL